MQVKDVVLQLLVRTGDLFRRLLLELRDMCGEKSPLYLWVSFRLH